jgi:antitoxin HicB
MLQYPARIEKDGEYYLVSFPDFENIHTFGSTMDEALKNAEEALNGCLESDFERGFRIDAPSRREGDDVRLIPVKPHIAVALMLRQLRADQSQIEVARKLHISYQVYQRLENPRKSNPTIKTLEKIAQIYGKKMELEFV